MLKAFTATSGSQWQPWIAWGGAWGGGSLGAVIRGAPLEDDRRQAPAGVKLKSGLFSFFLGHFFYYFVQHTRLEKTLAKI